MGRLDFEEITKGSEDKEAKWFAYRDPEGYWKKAARVVRKGVLKPYHNKTGAFQMLQSLIAYAIGVVFFKLDGIIPFAHAIWHVFVILGTAIQFRAVNNSLI
ncbi:hypothetical protein Ciccas_002397 [Cichlidogyrus casuarinus]|uniref:Uncharacterized protein n=1 Tax=Cichlidogyrus casuarinus TaxID=1844966 RepID=A0ABD2QHD5_9PLAT